MNSVNRNPETGIRYGYISANSLHPDVVDTLCYGTQAVDKSYEAACNELSASISMAVGDFLSRGQARSLIEYALEMFEHECEEAIFEGVLDGVQYRTSWLGGALHVWIFDSLRTALFEECGPCVPGAGNLDCPSTDGVLTYDVPFDWRKGPCDDWVAAEDQLAKESHK